MGTDLIDGTDLDSTDEEDEKFWDEEIKHAMGEGCNKQKRPKPAKEKVVKDDETDETDEEDSEATDASSCRRKKRKRRKSCGKRKLAPFIKFYLTVYKELCGKCHVSQIAKEAARRWRNMTCEEKAKYSK